MICAKFMIFVLLALPGLIDAEFGIWQNRTTEAEAFLDEVYREHNQIRKDKGVRLLGVDKNLEEILQRLGYNSKGHGHAQKDNLKSYAKRVTGSSSYWENWRTSGNFKHTIQTLFHKGKTLSGRTSYGWMYSKDGHKETILESSLQYMGCSIGSRPSASGSSKPGRGRDYSYTCAFIGDYKDSCYTLPMSISNPECGWYGYLCYSPSC